MEKKRHRVEEEGLGKELEALLASVPPAKAPAWLAAKTLARLRVERAGQRRGGWFWFLQWRWLAAGLGATLCILGILRWDRTSLRISDAEVYAALHAMVQEEEESRWWSGL